MTSEGHAPADAEGDVELDETGQAIMHGQVSTADPAVVKLWSGANFHCTGSLIAPSTVLTAAHCLPITRVTLEHADIGYTESRNVLAGHTHPDYVASTQLIENDIALLRLDAPVTAVTPLPWNSLPLGAEHVGQALRKVGYGRTETGSAGQKRQITLPLQLVDPNHLRYGGTTGGVCYGDSGGPGLMLLDGDLEERVVSVSSYVSGGCWAKSNDERVDIHAHWLRHLMVKWEAPTCAVDGACKPGCAVPDPDCECIRDGRCTTACYDPKLDQDCTSCRGGDGRCEQEVYCELGDADCRGDFQSCANDAVCTTRSCQWDIVEGGYCAPPCSNEGDCPGDTVCAQGRCLYRPKQVQRIDDPCTAADLCFPEGAICAGRAGEEKRCALPCASARDCPSSAECVPDGDTGVRFCARAVETPKAAAPGPDAGTPVQNVVPEEPSGPSCSAVGTGPGSFAFCLPLALGVVALRRRRR